MLEPVRRIVLRREDYADPPPAAPDDMAKVALSTRRNIESELMGYAVRACDLQRGARGGQISDGAIGTLAGKFQPSRLEYPSPGLCASLKHFRIMLKRSQFSMKHENQTGADCATLC
jgi:hypothetical protein